MVSVEGAGVLKNKNIVAKRDYFASRNARYCRSSPSVDSWKTSLHVKYVILSCLLSLAECAYGLIIALHSGGRQLIRQPLLCLPSQFSFSVPACVPVRSVSSPSWVPQ